MNQTHERANLLVELGRYEQALPVFTEALAQAANATERAEIFADMAGCLASLGRLGEAEQLFRDEVLPHLSSDEWAMHRFAILLFNRKKLTEADTINQQLLADYPDSSVHHVVKAKLRREQRRFVEAWAVIQEARRIDPDDDYAQTEELSILAFWRLSTRAPITPFLDVAVPNWEAVVEQALARAPSDPPTRLLAGEIYAKNGRHSEAREHLLDALQLDPSYQPYVVNSLQWVLAYQHPLMRFCFGWLHRYADIRIDWLLVLVFGFGLALKPLASWLDKRPLPLFVSVFVVLAIPPILIYVTSWMLVEFTPLGRTIMSRQDKWWSRLLWLGTLLLGGSMLAFALSILA